MLNFTDPIKDAMKEVDEQLWHACAGGMVQMPAVGSSVFYFPQGHAEHAAGAVDFAGRLPAAVPCAVAGVRFMADADTDEVFAKLRLVPAAIPHADAGDAAADAADNPPPAPPSSSFAKTLTQSDANNGGGFSVPRYCAETIFPQLDYTADPPVQTVLARDVHGHVWKFRHIYRGTPRRHLLTTGWSIFVNQKKLVAGDSIVFLKTSDKDLCVGIRRAKRGVDSQSGWNPYNGLSMFLREEGGGGGKVARGAGHVYGRARVRPECVVEAARLAAAGKPFEVVYYPRTSTPEFVVKASAVNVATRVQWRPGMRFKMAFETEDSSRISWFMGTISSVQPADPVRWPTSPWRALQVTWDEPDLLQNVKCVNPWLVELVSNMPAIHLTPFSPPRKKLRLPVPQHLDFPVDGEILVPKFSGNPHLFGFSNSLCGLNPANNAPAGIQGARHTQFGLSLSDLHLNKLQSGVFPGTFRSVDLHHTAPSSRVPFHGHMNSVTDNVSCLLSIGNSGHSPKKAEVKTAQFILFGQPILTEEQLSGSNSGSSSSDGSADKSPNSSPKGLLDKNSGKVFPFCKDHKNTDLGLETGHCKVFMESEDVGRTLDLSVLGSYEELFRKLAHMFGIERSETLGNVLYRDAKGAVKHIGDDPFSEFTETARRLTILLDSGIDNIAR